MRDWVHIGAYVERPDGFIDAIISVHEDNGIRLLNGCRYYCRTELKPFVAKPTKTELIDKAIDDLGGDIRKVQFYNCPHHLYLKYNTNYAYNYVLCHKNSFSVTDGLCFCTIEEFEQRKKEREMEKNINNTHWYDYENMRMLKSPPVGEIVLVSMDSGKEHKAKVLEITHNTNKEIFIVRVFNGNVEGIGDLKYKEKARPLDWDKLSKRKYIVNKALDVFTQGLSDRDGMLFLYDAGMLKLPEEK